MNKLALWVLVGMSGAQAAQNQVLIQQVRTLRSERDADARAVSQGVRKGVADLRRTIVEVRTDVDRANRRLADRR